MMTLRSLLCPWFAATLALTSLLSAPAGAQFTLPVADGFRANLRHSETRQPSAFSGFAVDPVSGDLFAAVGSILERYDFASNTRSVIRAFGPSERIGLIVHPALGRSLYYSNFSTGTLHRRDLPSGVETTFSLPANTFDLDATRNGEILVSANPTWPAPQARNGIWLIGGGGGSAREVIQLSGVSGPLAIDPFSGALYCATLPAQSPMPPGSVQVLRFSQQQLANAIAGGPPLVAAHAAVVASGLDGAYDLALDNRGSIYVSDSQHADVRRIRNRVIDPIRLVERQANRSALSMQFVPSTLGGFGVFAPYQPEGGGQLLLATGDWTSFSAIHAIEASRPSLAAPTMPVGGATTAQFNLAGLPANQTAWLLASGRPIGLEFPAVIHDGVPLWLGFDLLMQPIEGRTTSDAQGRAAFRLASPGGIRVDLTFQGFSRSLIGGAPWWVSTPPVTVRFVP